MFAWSSTVNKVSDLILKEMVLSFDLFKEKDFSYIHMQVAFSRVTSLNGVYLVSKFNDSDTRADPGAGQEYHRL